jgi:hypothetical protein
VHAGRHRSGGIVAFCGASISVKEHPERFAKTRDEVTCISCIGKARGMGYLRNQYRKAK